MAQAASLPSFSRLASLLGYLDYNKQTRLKYTNRVRVRDCFTKNKISAATAVKMDCQCSLRRPFVSRTRGCSVHLQPAGVSSACRKHRVPPSAGGGEQDYTLIAIKLITHASN